jgi:hypothetical protein
LILLLTLAFHLQPVQPSSIPLISLISRGGIQCYAITPMGKVKAVLHQTSTHHLMPLPHSTWGRPGYLVKSRKTILLPLSSWHGVMQSVFRTPLGPNPHMHFSVLPCLYLRVLWYEPSANRTSDQAINWPKSCLVHLHVWNSCHFYDFVAVKFHERWYGYCVNRFGK